ncbi:MAG TPA: GNAT family protein [Bacteroidia bacterium]|nr:GNAT family protein [Bacteroidia bacterium]
MREFIEICIFEYSNSLMIQNISLRPWEMSDLSNLTMYANNPKIAQNLTNAFPHPYSNEAGIKFIEMARSHFPVQIFAICNNNEAIGGIGVHPQHDIHEKCAELGYWLAENYWGKGIMSQAVIHMINYTFNNFDVIRLYARPFSSNMASQKVLEKCGFIHEATLKKSIYKNGVFLDELIYSIVND